ncbi:uncharacterized protein LOC117781266 [Drosophila innubila]|uniref:uncharacterized protein LOC117781266 n=1 Tax=Drosophila innubila TaxID=198719 RepID=UPI00148E280B|nr:uncharacterized protein LOC117781266 [Drosophila innubila]
MDTANTMDNASNYEHKKFTALKRKRSQDEEEDDVVFVMELPAKRRFFRPWLDEPQAAAAFAEQPPRKPTPPATLTTTYHANMVRNHKPRLRSPKAQQRRDRNTLACLLSRRARQAKEVVMEQQYNQFKQQHQVDLEQQVRLSLYYVRFLQEAVTSTQPPLSAHHFHQLRQIGQSWPQQQGNAMKR